MKKKKGGRILAVLAVLVLLVLAGGWLADRKLKDLGHPGLRRFANQLAVNYPKGLAVEPIVLSINVNEHDLEHLQRVVEDARARGVIIPEGNDYVPAAITGPEGSFKAKVRIKGKLTDHVKGDKWSFRVIAKKNGGFLGMRRFSLQHPGTRNYLNDWFYHKLMEGEGVIALRYGFIRLNFNGDDLGVYAYEEHFGPELLENNKRMEGPIFRFDPGLYWEHRLNEMRGLKVDGAYAEFQAATVDAYDTREIYEDPEALRHFTEAVGLIDRYRRGELKASEVFDADKIARRHAILDLIGGHHSMDFSDVKFYYDPVAQRIEPVSYESFSAFPIRTLAGSYRFTGVRSEAPDLHDAYFNDPELFRLYVQHLERYSRRAYLDSAFQALGPALDSASAIIYQEFPWKELDRKIFYQNQKAIQRLLDVPKGFHAHVQRVSGDTLEVLAVPIEALPLEVHGLRWVDGSTLMPIGNAIVPARRKARMGEPVVLRFLLPEQPSDLSQFVIGYSVLGSSAEKDVEVFPYPIEGLMAGIPEESDLSTFPFLVVDESGKRITFRSGEWAIDRDLVIPKGYSFTSHVPLKLDLQKGARVISHSSFSISGRSEAPVRIVSSDNSGGGFLLIGAGGVSRWENVEWDVQGLGSSERPSIVVQDAKLTLRNCRFGGDPSRDLVQLVRSDLDAIGCQFAGGKDQLAAHHSKVILRNFSAYGASDEALIFNGGIATLNAVELDQVDDTGVDCSGNAEVSIEGLVIKRAVRGIELSEGAVIDWKGGSIEASGEGVVVKKVNLRHGPVKAVIEGVAIDAAGEPMRIAEGNSVSGNSIPKIAKAQVP